ncbi:MAG: hypothetical protein PVI26_12290, partial [Chitinispirillia bacterium]
MRYDLIITKISKSVSKQIVARQLASDPSISHNDALMLLDNLPFVYLKMVSEEKMESTKSQLERLGVFCIIRESLDPYSEDTESKLANKNISENINTTLTGQKRKNSLNNFKSTDANKITFYDNNSAAFTEKRNNRKIKIIIFSTLVLIIVFVLFLKPGNNSQKLNIINNIKKIKNSISNNSRVEALKIKKSKTYLDSAKQMSNDISKAIKFYKIALSFNRYNLAAWQGLLKAYQKANMWPEAQATKKQIEDIFGNSIF